MLYVYEYVYPQLYTMCTFSITWCCPKGHRSTALGRATVKIPQVAIVGGTICDGEHLPGAANAPRSTTTESTGGR